VDQDGDYEDGQESSGKGLRGQLEQALADKKALEAEVAELRGKARQTEVSNVLTAKGVNPKVAKFIPTDVEGEEGISKWLEENADLFGATSQDDDTQQQDAGIAPEVKESASRLQNLGSSAQSPSKLDDIEARMASAQTSEELQELWAEAQRFVL
jgi:hypothetical protein